eukprot:UN04837
MFFLFPHTLFFLYSFFTLVQQYFPIILHLRFGVADSIFYIIQLIFYIRSIKPTSLFFFVIQMIKIRRMRYIFFQLVLQGFAQIFNFLCWDFKSWVKSSNSHFCCICIV